MHAIEELRYLILAAQREGDRALSAALNPIELTTSQAEVLRVLYDCAPLSLLELGERLVCETGSPSRLVNTLVEKQLVERSPSATDRRMVTLLLTPSGRQLAEQVKAIEQGFYAQIGAVLESMPVEAINAALWRFVDGRPTGKALTYRKNHF
ncbi:MAG: MarR family transcriptional regulator [Stenomitos rutilans HA7619-LM2]|jgi:DNA-binding MarR family transcriptional regulator|nr:MarR family transcriptional regulator [Stenomitos rutilans HA7619-LM2]